MSITPKLSKKIIYSALSLFLFTTLITETAVAATNQVNVWWPTANTTLSGTQPFKAVLDNRSLGEYSMYWQVDNGGLVKMDDNQTDYPHKEVMVDVTNWNWNSSGAYTVTFVAKDQSGSEISRSNVIINNTKVQAPINVVVPAPLVPTGVLYVNPNSPSLAQAASWSASRPADAAIMKKIGSQSAGSWYGGWNTNVTLDIQKVMSSAKLTNSIPTLVAYNIPGRDCQGYSAGGASSKDAYLNWINQFSIGIADSKAIVILEPDALSNIDCLSTSMQSDRYSMLLSAVNIFKANNSNAKVYIDAGHSGWIGSTDMAARLSKAGVQNASGFSLNVSNFVNTSDNTAYGQAISGLTNNTHFVIDTARNGLGSNGEWCNPSGRAIGQSPTLSTGVKNVDAYLWVKPVGESDGTCNGGPNAGVWWADYALQMAKLAGY